MTNSSALREEVEQNGKGKELLKKGPKPTKFCSIKS